MQLVVQKQRAILVAGFHLLLYSYEQGQLYQILERAAGRPFNQLCSSLLLQVLESTGYKPFRKEAVHPHYITGMRRIMWQLQASAMVARRRSAGERCEKERRASGTDVAEEGSRGAHEAQQSTCSVWIYKVTNTSRWRAARACHVVSFVAGMGV